MDQKLVNKVRKLYEQHSQQQVQQAIDYIAEQQVWTNMNSQQREQFFRDECARLGLTIYEGTGDPARCLFVTEFKDKTTQVQPYFMFWRESTSHKDAGHIEFGHWHMNRKLEKEYPGTEYCYGSPKEQQAMMQKYVNQLKP
jgi:hypothetical protein